MDFIDNIKTDSLIISNDFIKNKILNTHKLLPIKFMYPSEFISNLYFSYDEKAILYLINKYGMKYEVAKNYLENLYYVDDIKYDIEKLDFLVKIKQELRENNLLIYNENFNNYLKRVNIILYEVDINDFIIKSLNGLKYQIIERNYHNYPHKIIEFNEMEKEVTYVANKISALIDNGIDINNIKLANIDESYYNTLERIFSLYNLKINITYQKPLSSEKEVKDFITNYQNNSNIEESLANISKDSQIYNELIKVINNYQKYDNKDLLIYKIEHTYLQNEKYTNAIELIDYNEYITNPNEYVFLLGFNDGIIPKWQQDTKYITDNIRNKVGLKDTKEINKNLFDKTILLLNDIKNLTITYKLNDFKDSFYPSTLSQKYDIIKPNINIKESYSEINDEINLAISYDNYYKYGTKSKDFDILNANYQIPYNTYSNKFTGIKHNHDSLRLSYSKMQTYNKCAFRYYIDNILKLNIYEENFSTIIGSMVHYVMEKCLSNNSNDIEKYVNEFIKDKTFTKKETFFLHKYKECIKELLNQITLEKEYSIFNQAMYEKKIDIDYGDNVHFSGIIDKILYYISDNTTYIALIDYKTGHEDINLKYLKYGLNIQLPIYLYLSTKINLDNPKYVGFYLQRFNIIDKDYRLIGYSNSDKQTLSIIDKNYYNSKIIKNLKVNNDGSFHKNSKILTDEEINLIKEEAKIQINNVINNIKQNRFDINPKTSEGKNIGCEYCKYKDICFVTKDDELEIPRASEVLTGGEI